MQEKQTNDSYFKWARERGKRRSLQGATRNVVLIQSTMSIEGERQTERQRETEKRERQRLKTKAEAALFSSFSTLKQSGLPVHRSTKKPLVFLSIVWRLGNKNIMFVVVFFLFYLFI